MSEAEQLEEIKRGLGVTGSYQDQTLLRHLKDVKAYCISAGVSPIVLESDASLGCLFEVYQTQLDTGKWHTQFSVMFTQRLIQLISISKNSEVNPVVKPKEIHALITPMKIYETTFVMGEWSG
jgi:hypothetical protein